MPVTLICFGYPTPEAAARRQCWFVDSKGLVVKSSTDLAEHKLPGYRNVHY